jgi:hypothetical protein
MRWTALVLAGALLGCGSGDGADAVGEEAAEDQPVGGEQPGADVALEGPAEWTELLVSSQGRYTKAGWNHYGPGYFELDRETGVLTSHGGMGLFWYSVQEDSDFEMELEFMCSDAITNSGVFVRVPGVPTSDDYIYHSFEIQIDDSQEGIHMTGAAYDAEPASRLASRPAGEWNHFKITFVGDHLAVELNGEGVVDWEAEPRGKVEDFAPRGYVGLQNHDDESPVYFRNIRIREVR